MAGKTAKPVLVENGHALWLTHGIRVRTQYRLNPGHWRIWIPTKVRLPEGIDRRDPLTHESNLIPIARP